MGCCVDGDGLSNVVVAVAIDTVIPVGYGRGIVLVAIGPLVGLKQ